MAAVGPSREHQRVFGGETHLAGSSAPSGGGRGLTMLQPLSPSAITAASSAARRMFETGGPSRSSLKDHPLDATSPSLPATATLGGGQSSLSAAVGTISLGSAACGSAERHTSHHSDSMKSPEADLPQVCAGDSLSRSQEGKPQQPEVAAHSDLGAAGELQPAAGGAADAEPPTAEELPAARKRILVAEDDRRVQSECSACCFDRVSSNVSP